MFGAGPLQTMTDTNKAVYVRGLTIALSGGSVLVDGADLEVAYGQVVSLLGPSGGGKTTLLRALTSPRQSRREGLRIKWTDRHVSARRAHVPQKGALLDYLDVPSNVSLAQAGNGLAVDAARWLRAVELDESVMLAGRRIESISGGEAQRVAVARVLAAGRKLITMDEPSIGCDVMAVRGMARLLVKQAREQKAAIILVTHDLDLAAGASDKILFLDPVRRSLVEVPWVSPAELDDGDGRRWKREKLQACVEGLMLQGRVPRGRSTRPGGGGSLSALWRAFRGTVIAPVLAAGDGVARAWGARLHAESAVVFRLTLRESLVRPALFFAAVGGLLGFTVPYVIANISQDLRAAAVFELIKGTYILSLAPPLSAIVFAATSGSAVNAWLGGLQLQGQVTALGGVGVSCARYLWSPAWRALVLAYVVAFGVFTLAMLVGGWVLYSTEGVDNAAALLTADFLGPPPSRRPYLLRGLWSVGAYALFNASIAVARGRERKATAGDVTGAMTSSVMRTTLLVVSMELLTVILLRRWET